MARQDVQLVIAFALPSVKKANARCEESEQGQESPKSLTNGVSLGAQAKKSPATLFGIAVEDPIFYTLRPVDFYSPVDMHIPCQR